jgi:pyruvate dehydrogenase E1 component alpha subunit
MAGLWGHQGMCPIIFVIENNGYAMGTSVERHSALTDLAARVRAYDIPTEKVDGQDIFAVRGVADRVVRQVRETGKPYCIEAMTYRFSGHGAADILQPYRPKEEVEKHKQRDPIAILRNRLAEVCGLSDEDVKAMDDRAIEMAGNAVKFAEEAPLAEPEQLFTDVVAEHGPRPCASEHGESYATRSATR